MRLISFDTLRTLDIPGIKSLKPEHWFRAKEEILSADWILFPEYWQVNPLVYAWKKAIFPSISTFHLGHNKIEMTRAFQAICPSHVPQTTILASTENSFEQILDEFSFPFVAKEIRNSMGRGVHLIQDKQSLKNYINSNPILYIQEYLPIDRDLRLVIVGKKVVAAYWRIATNNSFHNNVAMGASISFENIPNAAIEQVEQLAQALDIDYAGFDVAMVDNWCFLFEFNVRFGTQALNQQGIKLGQIILQTLHDRAPFPWTPNTPLIPKAS